MRPEPDMQQLGGTWLAFSEQAARLKAAISDHAGAMGVPAELQDQQGSWSSEDPFRWGSI